MRLTAASYQAAFDYDDAIKTYLDLYETTKKAKKLGHQAARAAAGREAADARADRPRRRVQRGARLRAQPRLQARDRPLHASTAGSSPTAASRIARCGRSPASIASRATSPSMTETFDRWRAKFGRDAGNEDDYVQSFYDTAAAA